ncbi:4Fe-4S binding domain-containing protein [Geosporobacter subterraneus DSM 17957]|uniref:4Fe-4S binding domain-containing protein n=1 Tax=Geosporobacter subterraneus DSM 17957 TaxID=1121919 RepID=A0A1M6JYV3_9FIRM|nr:4Fe-4S binding protein [Geosporobacter subterraneus]SHJ51855.1 4Fe-4S binding domain-containing protein [Geosporobacter subterraneus DSM 17957]
MSEVKTPKKLKAKKMNRCIGCISCMLACARLVHHDYSPVMSAIKIRSSGGLQGKFVADICRGCQMPSCALACQTQALIPRAGGGIKYDEEKCSGCEKCVEACEVKAISFDVVNRKPIVCIQCGVCTGNCPHQVLSMEDCNQC